MKRQIKKPMYAGGGFIEDNGNALSQGAQMIGSMIPNDGGFGTVAGGVLSMGGQGAALGTAIMPGVGTLIGAGVGAVGGLIGGLFGNSKRKKQEEAARQAKYAQAQVAANAYTTNTSRENLAGYNTSGNTDQYYAAGGVLPNTIDLDPSEYEVEKGEVVQGNPTLEQSSALSSDMQLVGGNKHEQGGTDGYGGGRVYSDRLKLNKDATKAFKTLGLKLPPKSTYADVASRIGKQKGIAEKKLDSKIAPSIATGKRMLEDHDNALEVLFNLQELSKPVKPQPTGHFADGGDLPDPPTKNRIVKGDGSPLGNWGAKFLNRIQSPEAEAGLKNFRDKGGAVVLDALNLVDETGISGYPDVYENFTNPSSAKDKFFSVAGALPLVGGAVKMAGKTLASPGRMIKAAGDLGNGMSIYKNLGGQEPANMKRQIKKYAGGGNLPNYIPAPSVAGSFTGVNGLVSGQVGLPPKANNSSNTFSNIIGGVGNFLNQNQGQIINGLSYASNLNSISKLNTSIPRSYINAPQYNYMDRSVQARNDIKNTYRTTVNGLTSSSAGVNGSNAGALYGAALDATSRVNNQENTRRDTYNESYGQRNDRVQYANTMIDNQAQQDELMMNNEKNVAMPLQAKNAFLQGYAGNTAQSQRSNLEKQKMILSAYMNDQNGVLSRLKKGDIDKVKNLPIYSMFN